MTEKEPITDKQPVLVPRRRNSAGQERIETWHRTGKTNDAGLELVEGQFEETVNGETGIPQKWVKPEAFETEKQAELAEKLASTLGEKSVKGEVIIANLEGMMSGQPQDQESGSKQGRFGNGIVPMEPGAFKGDPRRVPGHPSNPATDVDFSKK